MFPWYLERKVVLSFCDFSHKSHNSSLIMSKISDKYLLKDILQNAWPAILKTIVIETEVWDTVIMKRSDRKHGDQM